MDIYTLITEWYHGNHLYHSHLPVPFYISWNTQESSLRQRLISPDSNTFYYAYLQQLLLRLTPRGPLRFLLPKLFEEVTPPKPITFLVKGEPPFEKIANK